jgi:hypothetical protein
MCAVPIILAVGLSDNTINHNQAPNTNILDKFNNIFMALHLFDVYRQTKKYNRNVYKYIFGEEE